VAINLGDINFGLGADTQRLQAAMSQVLQFGRTVNNAARSQAEGARAVEAALRRQERALVTAYNQTVKLNDALRSTGAPASAIASTTATFNRLTRELASGRVTALQFQRSMEDFDTSMGRVNRTLNAHKAAVKATADAQRDATRASRGGISAVSAAMREAAKSQREAAQAAAQTESALIRQERAIFNATQAYKRLEDAARRANAPQSILAPARQQLGTFTQTAGQGSRADQLRAAQAMSAALATARTRLQELDAQPPSRLIEALQKASAAAVLLAGPLSGVATRLNILTSAASSFSLAWAGVLAGVAGGAFAFYKMGTAAIDTAKKIETMSQTLFAVSGNVTIANTNMKYLMDFSDRAGQQFTVLGKQYAQLEAASKGTNLEGERTRAIFESIVVAGSKLGLSTQDVEGALRAVQQIMSKGTVQAEELRGQLGDRLPGAFGIMADALGVTTIKLGEMMKKGEVGSLSLVKFAEELKKRFGIDTSKQVDTIVAAENRFWNAITKVNDAMDKTVGFSNAYKSVLNSLSGGLTSLSFNTDKLASAMGIAAGALAGLFAPAIVSGILAVGAGVRAVTVAMLGLTAATATNPIGLAATVIMRLGLAAAGAYGGMKMMESVMGSTKQSMITALPPVEEYIKAQTKLKSTIRETTMEYYNQQTALAMQTNTAIDAAVTKLNDLTASRNAAAKAADPFLDSAEMAHTYNIKIAEAVEEVRRLGKEALKSKFIMTELDKILTKQTAEENKPRKDPLKDLSNSQEIAIKNAKDTIKELNQQYALLYEAPAQQEFLKTQLDINKAVENFRDTLQKALGDSPQGKGQVAELTERYAAALKQVKETELFLKGHTSYFQALEGVFARGLDTAMEEWIDTIMEGKDALEALKNVAKSVARDILRTFIQLAAMNPIKNALFGTNYTELGGSGGMGGLLGDVGKTVGGWFGSSNPVNVGSATSFAGGGIMTGRGPIRLKSYAGGGIARGRQLAEFGETSVPEAYVPVPTGKIPVQLSGAGGGSGVTINIHEAPGTKVTTKKSKGTDGAPQIDVYISKIAKDAVMEDIMSGGGLGQAMEQRYGLDRTRGLSS
jgi:tape measure domain-containing protein